MPEHHDGEPELPQLSLLQRKTDPPAELVLPKNRSTGNLVTNSSKLAENTRIRFSVDAGSNMEHDRGDTMAMSPVMQEHEHGLGISGLRRIRQQPSRPQTRSSSPEASFALPPRSSSMTLGLSSQRRFTPGSAEPSSPVLNFTEDLSRFPSESLHSFSFAHQSEDVLHNRQNVLRRSIDFMRDRLGWAANHPGLVTAQAKVTGDAEIQSMMELLVRANVLGNDVEHSQKARYLNGPLTGPADIDASNVFEKAFLPHWQSPENAATPQINAKDQEQKESVDPAGLESDRTEPPLLTKPNGNSHRANRAEARSPPTSPLKPKVMPISTGRSELKRTYTDISLLTLQTKLVETLARPYVSRSGTDDNGLLSPTPLTPFGKPPNTSAGAHSGVHGHANRWAPAAQAIFTTEAQAPWTILAANDLACLVFGVTKAEVRKLGILEVVREDRRPWLEERLRSPGSEATAKARQLTGKSTRVNPAPSSSITMRGGVTAKLLSKPPSRQLAKQRASTGDVTDSRKKFVKGGLNHPGNKSRGVLLCGDVVPIQKRNGATGSASLWVKEKRGGLIWVLEEISEDIVSIRLDEVGRVESATGSVETIWGESLVSEGTNVQKLIPRIPMVHKAGKEMVDLAELTRVEYYTAKNADGAHIPISISSKSDPSTTLRISSFPHIAGIMVLSAADLKISSSNSVFSAALFGQRDPDGMSINELVPQFDKILSLLTEEDNIILHDGIVIPEHSFRRARALLALRDGNADAAAIFLRPTGLVAKHNDGSEINVDLQMRVVRSERNIPDEVIEEKNEDQNDVQNNEAGPHLLSEVVYALWITYSRQLHSSLQTDGAASVIVSRPASPLRQPSPGQFNRPISPEETDTEDHKPTLSPASLLSQQIQEAASQPISGNIPNDTKPESKTTLSTHSARHSSKKKISEFAIIEEMGQGAYGQVKLAKYTRNGKKVVLKYVTKRRILVDTWTRDRRLGTVPLEIHVLDYLRKDGLRHPNIVEMTDFFEDDINYYIEMVPHGLPGMDLFDYIELRSTMDEAECRNIFLQVVGALHHLHTKALVVHRDIKDENIVLDGENKVKLIDFGSAAYIKNGPFEVFVGTIDYAAPEVLQGRPYRGKEQDVWALGILLYTLVYKENPFYSIDEIMDHELRIPWVMSEESINLIKGMLDRDVDRRLSITQVLNHSWCLGTGGDDTDVEI